MKSARFYFINKDAKSQSLSHSDKTERIKIHSHVQLGRKAQRSPSPPGNKSCDPSAQKSKPASKPQIHRWNTGRRAPVRKKRSRGESNGDNSPASSSSEVTIVWDQMAQETLNHISLAESIIPAPARSGSPVDPFDTSRVQVDPEVHRLLQYYLHHAHPNTYYTETHFSQKAKMVVQTDAHAIVKSCFDDEANMYTLLASMASRMRYLEKYDEQKDSSPLVSKAIASIQKRIKENAPMTQRMVFNMFQLGTAEFYRWDVAAALVHLKALGVLVQHLGGLKSIHHSLAEMIILGDGYLAAELGTTPVYSPTELDEESEALTPREGIEIMKKLLDGSRQIACGLLSPDQRKIVPTELRWIVMDMAVCLGVLEDHTSKPRCDDAPASTLHWLHLRNLAIRHRLMSLDLEQEPSRALRSALLIWDLLVFTVAGRVRTAKVVAAKLRERLSTISVTEWEDHEQVYFWILSVGAMSAAPDSDLHTWYVERIPEALEWVERVQGVDVTAFDAFAALESKFLYMESVQHDALHELWDRLALISGKRQRPAAVSGSGTN